MSSSVTHSSRPGLLAKAITHRSHHAPNIQPPLRSMPLNVGSGRDFGGTDDLLRSCSTLIRQSVKLTGSEAFVPLKARRRQMLRAEVSQNAG